MSTTLEALTPTDPQEHVSCNEVVASVLEHLEELTDPNSDAYRYFYGKPGIVSTELTDANRPAAGHRVLLKDETRHFVESPDGAVLPVPAFKRRGARAAAIFALQQFPDLKKLRTASAGNHGQGVAAAALEFGLSAEVHARFDVSPIKLAKMQQLGALVLADHPTLADAMHAALAGNGSDTLFVHPFDDIETIAGQATMGTEIVDNLKILARNDELDLFKDPIDITLPVGGGGLASGVALAIKHAKDQKTIGEQVRVVTVSATDKAHNQWCDGTATETGTFTRLVLGNPEYVQHQVTVSDLEIADAMFWLTGIYNQRIEPAAALAYAGATQLNRAQPAERGYARRTSVVPVTGSSVSRETYERAMQLRTDSYLQHLGVLAQAHAESLKDNGLLRKRNMRARA